MCESEAPILKLSTPMKDEPVRRCGNSRGLATVFIDIIVSPLGNKRRRNSL
jgi:hypothetical protein